MTLRVKFNNGNDLYTISNDALYYQADKIDKSLAAKVSGLYAINKFKEDAVADVLAKLKKANDTKYYKAECNVTATVTKDAASNEAAYELAYAITATECTTEDGTYTEVATVPALSTELSDAWDDAVTSAKADYKVSLYKGGLSYYNVRIKHFGEFETPWEAIADATANADANPFKVQPGGTVANIYGYTDKAADQAKANARFLGRYGVVRDNWYILEIDKIGKLGSATPEPVNGNETPDDEIEEEYYISAHVHIIPWVLRNQSVKF